MESDFSELDSLLYIKFDSLYVNRENVKKKKKERKKEKEKKNVLWTSKWQEILTH
jgi:hypothetical protein